MKSKYTLLMISLLWTVAQSGRCPQVCRCYQERHLKHTVCDRGGLREIPTSDIETDTQVLIITAPSRDRPNYLTIGRIFQRFNDLREIRIVHSNLPAIGDSSFWPGNNLHFLDLSHNNISTLRGSDFTGLKNLQLLNLSYNRISAIPSAPFLHLSSLKTLSLATNRIRALVPRFFYLLPKLEELDLSGNPLKDIDPEYLKDVKPLRKLVLSSCQLQRLHSLIYQQLPKLEELDLRYNGFKIFSPEEFRYLRKLKILRLDGNNLSVIVEKTFDGHSLQHLGLSRNQIHKFSPCAFCNASIESLDVSHNKLRTLDMDILGPLVPFLRFLNLEYNPLSAGILPRVLKLLYKLDHLALSGIGLTGLSYETFTSNFNLRYLNLSHNRLTNVSDRLLRPLKNLEVLDLSANRLRGLYPHLLEQLDNLTNLVVLKLEDNPWTCNTCTILPMVSWNSSWHSCESTNDSCVRCVQPPSLSGRSVHTLQPEELQSCTESLTQPRISAATSNVGLAVSITVVIILLLVVAVAIVLYRQQGAVYYTHEGERNEEYAYDPCSDRNGGDKRLAFVAMDRIDEGPEIIMRVNIR